MAQRVVNAYEQSFGQITFPIKLDEVLSDANFKAEPSRWNFPPGAKWPIRGLIGEQSFRNVFVDGDAVFRWVCNRSGGTLVQGMPVSWYSASGTATSGSTTTVTCLIGSFVNGEDVWNNLYISDDVGGAGAVPETEWGKIIKAVVNAAGTHITFTIRTARSDGSFSAAVAVGDTFQIRSSCQVMPCNALDTVGEVAGVVVRAAGIPDNYWGWIAEEAEYISVLIKAATAIGSAYRSLRIADDADGATIALSRFIAGAGGSLVAGQCVGMSLVACAADVVSDMIPARFRARGYGVDET